MTQPFPWMVQIAPGADLAHPPSWTWVDITQYVRQREGVRISFGRKDEWTRTNTTNCDLTLNNRDGRFSSRNPLGPWYGQLGTNTPLRVKYGAEDNPRFVGYVMEWPPRWHQSGEDATAPIMASGVMRRLIQGEQSVRSMLFQRLSSSSDVIAYWPCEDGRDATRIATPIEGVLPIRIEGQFEFAADSSQAGSDALPSVTASSEIHANVPARPGISEWHLEFVCKIDQAPPDTEVTQLLMMAQTTGTIYRWQIRVREDTVDLDGFERVSGTTNLNRVIHEQIAPTNFFGDWIRIALFVRQNGSNVDYTIRWFPIGEDGVFRSGSIAGSVGHITHLFSHFGPDEGLVGARFGHIGVFDNADTLAYAGADTGRAGELAGHRIERLCAEHDIAFFPSSDHIEAEPMGPQPIDTVMGILRDCERADGGVLYEVDGGLTYQTPSARYNQTPRLTLSVSDGESDGEVARPPKPTDDDQKIVNDITVERVGGSSVRVVDQQSIKRKGWYDSTLRLNLDRDSQLDDQGGWKLHLGTVDQMRFPSIVLDLRGNTHLIPDLLTLRLGDRITVDHSITQIPGIDIDVIVEGWVERFDLIAWTVQLNTSPAEPWEVAVLDEQNNVIDTDGSVTADAENVLGETETEMKVTTQSGPPWTTDPADFPFDVEVGGEVMRVTAIVDEVDNQSFTVERSINGIVKSHPEGSPVRLAQPAILSGGEAA